MTDVFNRECLQIEFMDGNLDREIFLRQEILLMYVEQNPINFFGQNRSEFFQRPWNIQDQAFIVLQLLQGLKIKRFTNFFGFNVFRETVHPHYNIKRIFLYLCGWTDAKVEIVVQNRQMKKNTQITVYRMENGEANLPGF